MSERYTEVFALHSGLTNIFVGTVASSIVASIGFIYRYIDSKGSSWDWLSVESVMFCQMCVIYYAMLMLGYRDLFLLYDHRSLYTIEVVPAIDSHAPFVKHLSYGFGFLCLVLYAILPVSFLYPASSMFFWFFVVLSALDLCWSLMITRYMKRTGCMVSDGGKRFYSYASQAMHYDVGMLVWSGMSGLILWNYPGPIGPVLLGVLLMIVTLYGVLSVWRQPPGGLFLIVA